MADIRLGQTASGRWNLSLVNNNPSTPSGLVIPVTLLYQGENPVYVDVKKGVSTSAETEWYTAVGTEIDTSKITVSGSKTFGDKTYIVTEVNWTRVTPAGEDLTLTYSGGEIPYTGGTARIAVSSSTGWTISSDKSWATVSPASGRGDGEVIVTFQANDGAERRSVTIMGRTTDGSVVRTLDIYQGSEQPTPVITHELIISATSYVIETEGELQLSAYYITKEDGQETRRDNVTRLSDTSWEVTEGGLYASVIKGKVTNTNTHRTDKYAVIMAEYSGESATQEITLKGTGEPLPVITYRLEVTPSYKTIEASGEGSTVQLTATLYKYENDVLISTTDVTEDPLTEWTSSNSDWATVSMGLVQGVNRDATSEHTATIRAQHEEGASASSHITVKAYVGPATDHKLEVTPSSSDIAADGTVQLTATFYSLVGGSWDAGEDVTSQATWTVVEGANYATVGNYSGNKGLVQGINDTYEEQDATISATYSGYTDEAEVTVGAKEGPEPEHYLVLVVTPSGSSIDWDGSIQMRATLYTYLQGQTSPVGEEDVTSTCDWSSNSITAVNVGNGSTNKGFVQGMNNLHEVVDVNIIAVKTVLGGDSATGSTILHVGAKPEYNLDIDTSNIDASCGEILSVIRSITSNSTWQATVVDVEHIGYDVEWATVTPATGQGNGSITIVINSENTGKASRDCFVRVRYPADSETFKSITVTQEPKPRFSVDSAPITVPQEGTMGISIPCESSHHLSLSNNGYDWIGIEEVETATGYTANIVVNTEATAERTGSVTIASTYDGNCTQFSPVTISVTQAYTPPVDPTFGYVYFYETETSPERATGVTVSAAAHDVEVWVSCTNSYNVLSMTEYVTLKKSNGDVLSVGDLLPPTGANHRVKLYISIPRNGDIQSGINHEIKLNPYADTHNYTSFTVKQRKDEIWHDNYAIFIAENSSDIDVDEINIPAIAAYYTPYVWIRAERHQESYPNPSTPVYDTMTDYVSNGGVLDGEPRIDGDTTCKITINVTGAGAVVSKDTAHSGPYTNCSIQNPYEIYIPENRTTGGQPRDYVMTLTYYPAGASMVTKSFTMHQAWSEPPHIPTNMHTLSGCTGNIIEATTAVTTAPVNGAISLECNSGSIWVGGGDAPGCTMAIGGEYGKFEIGGGIQFGVPFTLPDSSTGIALYFTNKASAGSSYSITINCSKPGKDTTIILITVTSV